MKVRIKDGECPPHITIGNIYEMHSFFIDRTGFGGNIINDICQEVTIRLDDGKWEIVDKC